MPGCNAAGLKIRLGSGSFGCDSYGYGFIQAYDVGSVQLLNSAVGNGVLFRRLADVPGNTASGWNNDIAYLHLENCEEKIELMNIWYQGRTTPPC